MRTKQTKNVQIYHLRQKLHPDLIQTIRGVGYIFKPFEQRHV